MRRISLIIFCLLLSGITFSQIDRSKAPEPSPEREIKLGKTKEFTLKNGLKVIVVENHKLPQVLINIYLDYDPVYQGEKVGLSEMVGSMLRAGTKKYSKEEFDEELDFLGSDIFATKRGVGISSLTKHIDNSMDLLQQILLYPTFENQKELDKLIKQNKSALEAGLKNPDVISGRVRGVLLYGKKHPYGQYITESSLDNIELSDVKEYYKTYFNPKLAYLTIVGDISFRDAKKLAKRYFGKWESVETPSSTYAELPKSKQVRVALVDLPTATQSSISIFETIDYKKSDKNYFAALLANGILGSGSFGRLFKNIREDKGWTYGAYSRLNDDHKVKGHFLASAKVRNQVTDSAIVEFLKEIKKITNQEADQGEIDIKKAEIAGDFARGLERPETLARYASTIKIEDLADNFYSNYIKNINRVGKAEIKNAISSILNDKMTILVVGKAEEIAPKLNTLGYPIDFYDIWANKISDPTAKESAGDIEPMQVVENYLNAIGGRDRLDEVNTIQQSFEFVGLAPVPLAGQLKRMNPNKFLNEIKFNGVLAIKQRFNGETGEISGMQNTPFSKQQIEEFKSVKGIFEELYYDTDELAVQGIVTRNGQKAYKIKVGHGDKEKTQYFSIDSGLLIYKEEKAKTADGKSFLNFTSFSDYKEFGGVRFPTKIITPQGTMNVSSTLINVGIKESEFD